MYPKLHAHLLQIYKLYKHQRKQTDKDTVSQALWSVFCCDHLGITTNLRLQLNNSTCSTLKHFVHSVQTETHSYSPHLPRLHVRSFDKERERKKEREKGQLYLLMSHDLLLSNRITKSFEKERDFIPFNTFSISSLFIILLFFHLLLLHLD